MTVAYERAKGFLYEATELIMLKATPTINLTDYDKTYEQFNFDLNKTLKLYSYILKLQGITQLKFSRVTYNILR